MVPVKRLECELQYLVLFFLQSSGALHPVHDRTAGSRYGGSHRGAGASIQLHPGCPRDDGFDGRY